MPPPNPQPTQRQAGRLVAGILTVGFTAAPALAEAGGAAASAPLIHVLGVPVEFLLFAATLTRLHLGSTIALLFIASMVAIGVGFAVFLVETRIGAGAVRVRSELLQHRVDDRD